MFGKAFKALLLFQLVVLSTLAPTILAEPPTHTPHRHDLSQNFHRHSHSLLKLQKRARRILFDAGPLPTVEEGAPLEPDQALHPTAPTQPAATKGTWFSNFRLPWSKNPNLPPSSTRQMNQLLRNPLPQLPGRFGPLLSPAKYLGEMEAVKLPGNGWDAHTVQQMHNKGNSYLVEGANGKVWIQHPGLDGTKFVRIPENFAESVRAAISRHAYPTVETPNYAFSSKIMGTEAKSGGSWLSRLTEGARGWVGKASNAFKYVRGP